MATSSKSVARVMLKGPDSRPDDSYNARRQLIETIAFAISCTTVDAALMLFWLERIVAAARLRDYRVVCPYGPELETRYYLLFAQIFRPNSAEPPNWLMQQITQYLLDANRREIVIQHTRIGRRLVHGHVIITVRRMPLSPTFIPASKPDASHQQDAA